MSSGLNGNSIINSAVETAEETTIDDLEAIKDAASAIIEKGGGIIGDIFDTL